MQIKTLRLSIREFTPKDINDVYAIYNNIEVCQFLPFPVWDEDQKVEKFNKKLLQKELSKDSILSLACVCDEIVIGDISIWYTDMIQTVELGYAFHKDYNGKGYATEALQAIVTYVFRRYPIHRIQANLDARNVSSALLCERIGMRKEAHFVQDYWNKGEWTDSYVYGMLRSDLGNDEKPCIVI